MRTGLTSDEAWMRRALELARRGWGQVSPNPLVGAVLVNQDEVVGEGWHAQYGGDHAEVAAIAAAGPQARGATLYVSLEPCNHTGKTPPCTDAILTAGIARTVVATADPNPLSGGGTSRLRAAGMAVDVGLLEAEARELNASFMHCLHSDRPWVTLKFAVSLDGAIADASHTTSRVTGPAARRYAHHLRAGHDAVAVGMNTVRKDNPLLTVRDVSAPRVAPSRVVFSRHGHLSLTSSLATSIREAPVIVAAHSMDATTETDLREHGVDVVLGSELSELLRRLRERGLRSVLVEGGTALAGAFWNAALVDRLILVQAPVVFGQGALNAFGAVAAVPAGMAQRFRVVSREVLADDVATTYAVREL